MPCMRICYRRRNQPTALSITRAPVKILQKKYCRHINYKTQCITENHRHLHSASHVKHKAEILKVQSLFQFTSPLQINESTTVRSKRNDTYVYSHGSPEQLVALSMVRSVMGHVLVCLLCHRQATYSSSDPTWYWPGCVI